MAFIILEDLTGQMEIIVFPTIYEKFQQLLLPDMKLVLKGRITYKEDEPPKIIAEEIFPLDTGQDRYLILSISERNGCKIEEMKNLFDEFPGQTPVVIYLDDEDKAFLLNDKVSTSDGFLKQLQHFTGISRIALWDNVQ